ncbi:MAG: TadE/TadG family type IV pilus assembly protein [Bacillota bacterium]|nr:TadE/TadG family type IV pilus assembly protein [Bacillota bacterium]
MALFKRGESMSKLFNNKGQSMVEFTLILPIFLILLIAMFDTSRVLNTKFILENAARNAARIGSVSNSDVDVISEIDSGTSSLDDLNLSYTIVPQEADRTNGDNIVITINYSVDINTPLISNIIGDSVVVSGKSAMRIE